MKKIVLLRGVTPVGKNKIPKMSYLAEIIEQAGFSQVQTYIQSGNVVVDTELNDAEVSRLIHDVILAHIGADLSVIVKEPSQLRTAVQENPFDAQYDYSRIHLVFTNDAIDDAKLNKVLQTEFDGEVFRAGSACLYMYLPRDAKRKRLNTNYLEKQLGITATMRKLNVISHLCEM